MSRVCSFYVTVCLMSAFLAGCAGQKAALFENYLTHPVVQKALQQGFEIQRVNVDNLTLFSLVKIKNMDAQDVAIYIEGDGHAFTRRGFPSQNPTPHMPTGLELALKDSSDKVVYLARPCQFIMVENTACSSKKWWTSRRFDTRSLRLMSQAVQKLVHKVQGERVQLTGFSGGAFIAAFVASHRNDVVGLKTVSGNLDPNAVNRAHKVREIPVGVDVRKLWQNLHHLPQKHMIGRKDKVIKSQIAQHYEMLTHGVEVVEGKGHNTEW